MSILCIGRPMEAPVAQGELQMTTNETDRFFLPGELHGGDYIIRAYPYENDEGVMCLDVIYIQPEDILGAKQNATDNDGKFHADVFIDTLDSKCEKFIVENIAGDCNFEDFNRAWLAYGMTRTPEELIAWYDCHPWHDYHQNK